MLAAAPALFADLEKTFIAVSGLPHSGERFCSALEHLEEAGCGFRREATAFLTSDAAASFDENLVYDAKRHVHTDLGSVLTKTHLYLHTPDSTIVPDALLAEWQEVISSLQSGTWKAKTVDAKKQITDAGCAAGVQVFFSGDVPADEAELRAYMKEATTRILAAVRAGEETVTL